MDAVNIKTMTAYFRAPNIFIVPNKRMCGDFQNKIEPSKTKIDMYLLIKAFRGSLFQKPVTAGRKTFWEAQYFQVALDTKSNIG